MTNNYSGYFLSSGNGADSEYFTAPIDVHPGATLSRSEKSGHKILLAGGFSTIHPDSPFPLSSTLQLNGDLTETNDTEMSSIARAEFIRHNSQSYRSYTLESDPRVTVIGASAESLQNFMETYGGVLEIDAILTKGYDQELTTAQDLQIRSVNNSYIISFNSKQPVDHARCTYCGACGPACPEHCLSEQLFLDFSHCTFCKECLAACPHDAIDLYAVERRELHTPAIVLLDDSSIDLPEQQNKIYSKETLPALFASIYATEVDELIGWEASLCQYSPRLGTGCTACFTACAHGAIAQGKEGVQIDHLACVECGACLGVCPTGALQYKRFDDTAFVEYFRTAPLTPGTTVVLGTEEELHKYWWYGSNSKQKDLFFMEYPATTALHSMHFLLLYGMGATDILVLGLNSSGTNPEIEMSNTLLQSLFKQEQVIRATSTEELGTILAQEKKSSSLSNYYHDFSHTNRRRKSIDIIQFLRDQADSETYSIASRYFGEIICDEEKCTQCIACINECRMESLVADGATYSLNHTPVQCVQCGTCVTVCPENALTMKSGLHLNDSFFAEKTLSQAEPAKCKGCGKVFGTRKSLEKVMAILSSKNMWDSNDDLLSYCEDCRVVNLYQSSEKV